MSENKTSEKTVRSHPFCQAHPVIAMILFSFAGIVLIELLGGVFTLLLGLIMDTKAAGNIGTAAAGVAVLVLFKLWFSPQFKGQSKSSLSMKWTLLMTLPGIIYIVYTFISQLIQFNFYFKPSFLYATRAMAAGFAEEPMFRGLAIPIGMGFIKNEKRVWLVPIATSVCFGLFHLGNITVGATVFNGILQAFCSGMHGFYYGALLAATGSIIPSMLIHAIYDFVCFAGDPTLSDGIMAGELTTFAVAESVVVSIVMVAAGVYLLKKLGDQKMLSVWKKKWSQDDPVSAEENN